MTQEPSSSSEVDIYADENEPDVSLVQTIKQYRVEIPNTRYDYYAVLSVREDGYCELDHFKFHGVSGPVQGQYNSTESYALQREVWDWLVEWELVELKPIGPEDSEYFITHELEKTAAKKNLPDEEAGW
jgi:hypothetical protein